MNSECQAYSVTTRDRQAVGAVGAADQILDEQIARLRMCLEIGKKRCRNAPATSPCCCPTRHARRLPRRER